MKETQPLVTIVTPSYNQAKYLRATMESVFAQTYPNIEYIVIDGGSKDGSTEIIQAYEDWLAYWVSEPDEGQTDAINKGFARANGKYLAWLNSDDTYEPEAVTEAISFLETHPEVGLVYGDANYIDAEGKPYGKFPAAETDYQRLRRGYVHIPQQSAFWRADLWQQVGPLDPKMYFAMDYDLWLRLAKISKLAYIPKTWANFRIHEDAKTLKADDRCWQDMVQIHFRDGGSWLSIITIKFIIRKVLAPVVVWRRKRRMKLAQETE